MEHTLFQLHPEQERGETFIFNKKPSDNILILPNIIKYREGKIAYSTDGKVVEGFKPLFATFDVKVVNKEPGNFLIKHIQDNAPLMVYESPTKVINWLRSLFNYNLIQERRVLEFLKENVAQ